MIQVDESEIWYKFARASPLLSPFFSLHFTSLTLSHVLYQALSSFIAILVAILLLNPEGDPPQRKSEDLFDERRSVPVLPIFVLPSLSSRTFSLSTGDTQDRRAVRDS